MTNQDDTQAIAERIAESVKHQTSETGGSRRRFLRGSAAVGTLLALGTTGGVALADEHDEESEQESDNGDMTAAFNDIEGTDIDVLNYALTLEHLENAFYREGLDKFDEDAFQSASVVQNYSTEMDMTVREYVQTIGDHEAAHVEALEQAVTLLGGDPASEADYDFGIESVEGFLGLAQVFENTGVAAYAGAAPFVESPDLLSAALSIHSVEARHAAFLNDLNNESFYPNAFDPAKTQQEVLQAVTPFLE